MPGEAGAVPVQAVFGRDLQIARMNAGLMTTTVMSAVVVFLAGALLVAKSVRPEGPLVLLATSALGFIIATLLYANTYAWLVSPADETRFDAQIHRANVLSECFGIYCLLLAIPVTVVSVTADSAVRWFVAVITLVALVGYQLSSASLLQHYLSRHTSKWRRAVITLIGVGFTVLLAGLGAWLFVASLSASDNRLIPAFVIVALLLAAGGYAMWAEPLPTRAGVTAATSPTPQSVPERPRPRAAVMGPPTSPGLPTNAPPWAVAEAAAAQRRREPTRRPLLNWLLPLLTLLLVIATLVVVLVTLHDQHTANAQELRTAKQGQAAALSSIAALEGQTLKAQRDAALTTGELTAKVFVTRIRQALIGLFAVLRTHRELSPAVPLSDLHVSVPSGVAMLQTKVSDRVLTDLSNLFGQLHITYGNFHQGHRHRKLSHRDHIRVCRTIKFGNKALLDFRGVPRAGVSSHARATVPKECR